MTTSQREAKKRAKELIEIFFPFTQEQSIICCNKIIEAGSNDITFEDEIISGKTFYEMVKREIKNFKLTI